MAQESDVLLTTLITGSGVFVLLLVLLEILRRVFPRQYQYRHLLSTYYPLITDPNGKRIWAPPVQPTHIPLSWIPATYSVKDADIARHISIDAVVLIRFLRSLAYVYLALSVLTLTTLCTAYATGPHKNLDETDPLFTSGVLIITMSNVQRGGPQLWATWIVEVVIMVVMYGFGYRDYERFTWYARKSKATRSARNFAALVSEIPEELACEEGVRMVLERVYEKEQIVKVFVYVRRNALDRAKIQWANVLRAKERAMWSMVNKLDGERPVHECPKRRCCGACGGVGEEEKKMVDSIKYYAEEQERLRVEIQRAQEKCRVRDAKARVGNVITTVKEKEDGSDAHYDDEHEEYMHEMVENVHHDDDGGGGGALDGSAGEWNSRCAVVVFRTMHAAAMARQTQLWKHPDEFVIEAAPEPKEIRWHKLGIPSSRSAPGKVITFLLCVGITLLWSPVSIAIAALSNLEALTQIEALSWLRPILSWPSWILGIIQGVLPPLLINILSVLISLLFRLIITRGRHFSQGQVEDTLRNYYFVFLVFGHFLYVLISGSILSQLSAILSDVTQFITLLARAVPASSIYFCNYIFFGCFISFPQLLSQWIRIFQRGWVSYGLMFFPRTERDYRRLDSGMSSMFLYFKFYSVPLLIHLIAMVYSSVAPLINVFAFLYFTIAYWTCKHNLCFTHYNAFSTGGYYYFGVYACMITSLFVKQVFMIVLFSVFGAPAQALLEAMFLVTSIIVTVVTFKRFGRLSRRSSIVTIMDSYGRTIGKEDEVAPRYVRQYEPPSLQPLPFVYDLSGVTEQQADMYGLDLNVGNSDQGVVGEVPLAPRL